MNPAITRRWLLLPSVRRGNGTAHFRRILRIARELKAAGQDADIRTGASADGEPCFSEEELRGMDSEFTVFSSGKAYDVCVFDMRETPVEMLNEFEGSFRIGIDEGGSGRSGFDYLIDTLPNLEPSAPNIAGTAFLDLPRQQPADGTSSGAEKPSAACEKGFQKILLSFGGEDRAGLTGILLERLLAEKVFAPEQITIAAGPLSRFGTTPDGEVPDGVAVLHAPENLAAMLSEYDLVFTMFGMTCFEALYSGVPVILFSPSEYHRELAWEAGIPEIGVMKPELGKLADVLADDHCSAAVHRYSGFELRSLSDFLLGLALPQPLDRSFRACRACGTGGDLGTGEAGDIIYRSPENSFRQCRECGTVSNQYFGGRKMEYGADYFFEDYKKQYGRTYLEDFDKIKTVGLRRCRLISRTGGLNAGCDAEADVDAGSGNAKKAAGTAPPALLDIGCGYGPFLAAAEDSGFSPAGIDISENAALWVAENLGYPAAASSVEDFSPQKLGADSYDAVSMWFVIEHIEQLPPVLDKINAMIKPGGVFAFATPNYNGISRRRSKSGFLNANPLDHYTIWSPDSSRRLLAKYGFKIKKVSCPVIHPERFFKKGRYDALPAFIKHPAAALIRAAGRLFSLGDTFEVYAVKIKDTEHSNGI